MEAIGTGKSTNGTTDETTRKRIRKMLLIDKTSYFQTCQSLLSYWVTAQNSSLRLLTGPGDRYLQATEILTVENVAEVFLLETINSAHVTTMQSLNPSWIYW